MGRKKIIGKCSKDECQNNIFCKNLCKSHYSRQYRNNNPYIKEYEKQFHLKNREKYYKNRNEKYKTNKFYREKEKERARKYNKERYKSDSEFRHKRKQYASEYRQQLKISVFKHYSESEQPQCKNCGIQNIDVLCLDHINNDGKQQINLLGCRGSGYSFYYWLISNSFPEGLQVLCFNCNMLKEFNRRKK